MTASHPAVVQLDGGNLVLVIIVLLIALGALGMAVMFRKEVLAAGEGTDNMKNIAHAVQEGANAYLQRQFRTLAIFAAVAFVDGLAWTVRVCIAPARRRAVARTCSRSTHACAVSGGLPTGGRLAVTDG